MKKIIFACFSKLSRMLKNIISFIRNPRPGLSFLKTIFFRNHLVFIDIGELGWSLYLSGHVQWLKRYSKNRILILTSENRKAIFECADEIRDIPEEFDKKYSKYPQRCFGLHGVCDKELRTFFKQYIPEGYMTCLLNLYRSF